jgi:hypothetical protein
MKSRHVIAALLVSGALLAGSQVLAHHAGTMFSDEVKEVAGTVKEFQFTNPHSWILHITRFRVAHVAESIRRDRRVEQRVDLAHDARDVRRRLTGSRATRDRARQSRSRR